MADSLNIQSFAGSITNFARDNKAHIFQRLLIPGLKGLPGTPIWNIEDYMSMIPGNDEVVLTELVVGNVLQPGGKDTFNPTSGAVKFNNRKGKVRQCKVDLEFPHSKILSMYKSYLGQVRGGKIDPTTYPFEAFVIDAVIAKAKENLRKISLWNGVYNASGSAALDVFDGLLTQLTAAIADTSLPSTNITEHEAITATNGVAVHESIIANIPDEYFYSDLICVTNRTLKTAYEHDYRQRHGNLPYNSSTEKGFIDGTSIPFVVEPGLASLESPIFTTIDNFCYLYDDEGKMDNIDFDYSKRTRNLAYMLDFQAACGIAATELIWTGQEED